MLDVTAGYGRLSVLIAFFWEFSHIINNNFFLKCSIFTKLSQTVYLIDTHHLVCWNVRCDCRLWKVRRSFEPKVKFFGLKYTNISNHECLNLTNLSKSVQFPLAFLYYSSRVSCLEFHFHFTSKVFVYIYTTCIHNKVSIYQMFFFFCGYFLFIIYLFGIMLFKNS